MTSWHHECDPDFLVLRPRANSSTGIDPDAISDDGSDDNDDREDDQGIWQQRSPSPSSSVSHLAASFVQRIGTFVGGIAPRSPMLSDAELEAEVERERDRSRREAEAILTREAQQRRLVEDRVLSMMESTKSLPPPPSRSQTMPNPPSPSNSQKESGGATSWWSTAKSRLMPTKDPPTPAQQIILEAKAREKDNKKNAKGKEKEWPANAQGKFSDPAFVNLTIPTTPVRRVPVPSSSPSSPTPSRPSLSNMPPNLTPSPMRTTDTLSSSPSHEAPPLYTQFTSQGTLDVPGTLLMIAKRFEKLEKWTEADKEKEKEKDKESESESLRHPGSTDNVKDEIHDLRDEVVELQGRLGELGREMAKIATAPNNLSAGPKAQSAAVSVAPQTTSSIVTHSHPTSSIATHLTGSPSAPSTPIHHPRSSSTTARESTSPPMTSKRRESGTRLPYPAGDYSSPPDTFSPGNSPPSSISSAMRPLSTAISGLPLHSSSGLVTLPGASYSTTSLSGTGRPPSPPAQPKFAPASASAARTASPTPAPAKGRGAQQGLPPPKSAAGKRQTSVSPTPRKRYTVALGGPITAPDEDEFSSNAASLFYATAANTAANTNANITNTHTDPPATALLLKRVGTPRSYSRVIGGSFSVSPVGDDEDDKKKEDEGAGEFGEGEEIIGKSSGIKLKIANGSLSSTASNSISPGGPGGGDYKSTATTSPSPSTRRIRAQNSSTGIDPDAISDDGSDDNDDREDDQGIWQQRSPSPSSSVSHLAASFVQRIGTFVGGIAPRSPMLSDAELEAEVERERDRSRREAEAILTREAQQRRLVEDRVLSMMESTKSLPPPPSRSQTMPNPPSPSNSQKESGGATSWWSTAKSRLMPTKDPPTPAQQIILEAKAREKDNKKNAKGKEKEWPANAQGKFSDPAFVNLTIPTTPVRRVPVPSSSPSSPTPSRPSLSNMPPNLTPSPMRTTDTLSSSPSHEAPPLYTQFTSQGTLDVPGTLLMIAKRFEKLEKWTEADKEKEKEKDKESESESLRHPGSTDNVKDEIHDLRDEVVELQGRLGELGREMAKIATAPNNLSAGPKAQSAAVSVAPQTTSSIVTHSHPTSSIATHLTGSPSAPSTPIHHPRSSSTTARESTSPPMTSKRRESGTRLPYPAGDYSSPPDTFSPGNSPPSSISSAMRPLSTAISGLPLHSSSGLVTLPGASYSTTSLSGTGRPPSPPAQPKFAPASASAARTASPTPAPAKGRGAQQGLPPPKSAAGKRQTSVSPTPRKRYTVALGGPITAPDEDEFSSNAASLFYATAANTAANTNANITNTHTDPPATALLLKRVGTPRSYSRVIGGSFSVSPVGDDEDDKKKEDEGAGEFGEGEEIIGKSSGIKLKIANGSLSSTASNSISPGGPGGGDYKSTATTSPSPSTRRIRAQNSDSYHGDHRAAKAEVEVPVF
ncbi:uncharacterized protein LACBIDRAFT_335010 [Laccaria bicolor S238N-H82]|uniref:Predicted protein n=1 Tax=Laccaria bicolor (strain S238N-H82 / ATCC MYA-4686) TaxID=486041 RepID=B0E127_LACBS|nr:uncharacterized protein LACBIDRAFT_335010 [Laccaria bicolor S238N-H82]EDQ99439.1 predicted protein [Laccaria bicolor S238N-H82]|eukprot:XP_001889894.1 predicted protein [Laccaria bicolor S238N-H82]